MGTYLTHTTPYKVKGLINQSSVASGCGECSFNKIVDTILPHWFCDSMIQVVACLIQFQTAVVHFSIHLPMEMYIAPSLVN